MKADLVVLCVSTAMIVGGLGWLLIEHGPQALGAGIFATLGAVVISFYAAGGK